MRTLKFKAQPTKEFFSGIDQLLLKRRFRVAHRGRVEGGRVNTKHITRCTPRATVLGRNPALTIVMSTDYQLFRFQVNVDWVRS